MSAVTSVQHAPLGLEERIDLHRRMAESYRRAYAERSVQSGESYQAWTFAEAAEY